MKPGNKYKAWKNRFYFLILSLVFVFLLFFLLEVLLRMFSYGTDLRLFVRHDVENREEFLKVNPSLGHKYFSRLEATTPANDMFLRVKPGNGFRVFVLGSSSLFGYPYDFNLMASRILHRRLRDAFPGLTVEVVNTSVTAINSVTLRDFIPQVLEHEPDAILIYAGHNEFYGAFGAGSNETMSRVPRLQTLHFRLLNLRFYQLMRSFIERTAGRGDRDGSGGTLMARIVREKDIPYGGSLYRSGIKQFRSNMEYILKKASKQDVPVFISDLVSNVRDLPPFGTTGEGSNEAKEFYRNAVLALSGGDTFKARELFYRAKDLDPVRFRAPEEINEIIHELAGQYHASLIPVKEIFSAASGQLIGNNLLTEHVHPNIGGQFLLADAFYTAILGSGVTGPVPEAPGTRSARYYRSHWGYTPLDSLAGAFKIAFLKSHWPFTPPDTETTFRDTFRPSGYLDSLAFTILTDPEASFQRLHLQLAGHFERKGEYYRAAGEYEALVTTDPYNPEYHTLAATVMLKTDDLYAAEKYLRVATRYGNDPLAFSMLGEIEMIKHKYSEAAEIFAYALEDADPGSMEGDDREELFGEIRRMLSIAEERSQKPATPYSEYPQYIPHHIKPLYDRALKIADTDLDSALSYFEQCLEINDCPLVNFHMGNILLMRQDLSAMKYYDQAYQGFARDPDFLVRYCAACIYGHNRTRALEIHREITGIAPGHPGLSSLGQALNIQ